VLVADVERRLRFVRRALGLRRTFMEIGAGECAVARCAAGDVERAYAVGHAAGAGPRVPNFVPLPSDGVDVPLPEASVDAALSDGLIEKLHPRYLPEHFRGVRRVLRDGGRYFCITAARIGAKGLRALLAEAGFRKVRFYARVGGVYAQVPYWMARSLLRLHVEAFK
jgi:SAM-dependent methyltransferase